jgi:hypothetical protein
MQKLCYLGKTYFWKMHFEKKLKDIEIKMQTFRNISISQISTTPDRNYKQEVITSSDTCIPLM